MSGSISPLVHPVFVSAPLVVGLTVLCVGEGHFKAVPNQVGILNAIDHAHAVVTLGSSLLVADDLQRVGVACRFKNGFSFRSPSVFIGGGGNRCFTGLLCTGCSDGSYGTAALS